MFAKFHNLWFHVRASLWFVPSIMVLAAIGLSFATVSIDEAFTLQWKAFGSIYSGGPEGGREVLSTIAGSMIGITGVVFSITIVALTLASSQFGPRLLRNFMGDIGNQIVLGTFIATFVYCLLVLRVVRSVDERTFVPYTSIFCGMLLALASLGVLIYFIHHVSVSIQANHVVAAVSHELQQALERLFPERLGQGADAPEGVENVEQLLDESALYGRAVPAASSGYLQVVDDKALMHIASENQCLIRLEHRPGDFVVQDRPLMTIWPGDRVDERLISKLNFACIVGVQRTYEQDIGFAFHQLVEIAVRALSPGINDPFTAVACLDRIGAALSQMAERKLPSPYRYDHDGQLRVVAPATAFDEIIPIILDPMRQYSRSSLLVTLRLLDIIAMIAPSVRREADRQVLRHQATLIERGSQEGLGDAWDRQQVYSRYETAVAALNGNVHALCRGDAAHEAGG